MITLLLDDYTLQIVALGSALLGIISGVLGSFAVLRKQSLIGDAVSHAALPGIAIAFLLIQTKSTEILLLGALLAGILATLCVTIIKKYTRISMDSALGLVLSTFFGLGLVLLTYIQKIPNANQAGLEKFIFGQASTLLQRDVVILAIAGIVLLLVVAIFWKEFKLIAFDSEYAKSIGLPVDVLAFILSAMIVIAIILGLQTVGVILMSAMLVAPGVAARQWTDRLSVMIVLAPSFGALSGVSGTILSSLVGKMPTGPSIVMFMSGIVLMSVLFAPKRGLLWQKLRHQSNKKRLRAIQEREGGERLWVHN